MIRFHRLLVLGCVLAVAVAWLVPAMAGSERNYVREGDDLYRIENGTAFRVHPDVISVRFESPIRTLDEFLGAAASRGPLGVMAGLEPVRSNRLGIHDLRIPEGADVLEVVDAIRSTGLVEFAEENTLGFFGATPDDPLYSSQWGLHNTGQTGGTPDADVDAPEAWDLNSGFPSAVVAILDSGTDIDHQDLVANLWKNAGEIPGNGQDDDSNGFIDDFDGWDFFNNNNDPRGPFWHGTHVAGIVAATTNNGIGISGLAGGGFGGSGARMMPIGVGDFSPDGSILDDAIIYAADNGAHVITLSLTVGSSPAIDDALEYAYHTKGLLIDNAAGNSSGSVGYPANHPDVMAVSATDDNDNRASFSNFGPEIEVAAPGVDILSTQPGNSYDTSSGTSFSSPHVAGLAALMLSAAPGLENNFVRQVIRDFADDLGPPGRDDEFGDGRINARAALEVVSSLDPPEIFSIAPNEGLILGGTSVTILGANFFGAIDVRFGGIDSADVVVHSPTEISAVVPPGEVLGTVDVEVEGQFGATVEVDGFTYLSNILALGDPRIGSSVTIAVLGPPLQNWGLVKDLALGPAMKKGILWDIAFSPDWEIVHNSWRGMGGPLNGLGQGATTYEIPNDPGLVGENIYFQAVFDNLLGPGNEFVLSELVTVTVLPAE